MIPPLPFRRGEGRGEGSAFAFAFRGTKCVKLSGGSLPDPVKNVFHRVPDFARKIPAIATKLDLITTSFKIQGLQLGLDRRDGGGMMAAVEIKNEHEPQRRAVELLGAPPMGACVPCPRRPDQRRGAHRPGRASVLASPDFRRFPSMFGLARTLALPNR
jgi:hypothetical protein